METGKQNEPEVSGYTWVENVDPWHRWGGERPETPFSDSVIKKTYSTKLGVPEDQILIRNSMLSRGHKAVYKKSD